MILEVAAVEFVGEVDLSTRASQSFRCVRDVLLLLLAPQAEEGTEFRHCLISRLCSMLQGMV